MAGRQRWWQKAEAVRVVSHRPWRRTVLLLLVLGIMAGASWVSYRAGRAVVGLDLAYLDALERLNGSNQAAMEYLQARLVDADLSRQVDGEAARALKEDIRRLKDEVAALTEEVTFYKSLMAPSSLARGLQIADFELTALDGPGRRYAFHLLLTQVESRRDWVQGDATLEIHGRMAAQASGVGPAGQTAGSESRTETSERVLPLTEIAEEGAYPLKYRFRYFQDLTGIISLPPGFEPERIVVRAGKRGASTDALERTFDWVVAG